jgi:site-specific recombinase XerD
MVVDFMNEIENYRIFLANTKLAPKSQNAYVKDVHHFVTVVQKELADVNEQDVYQFLMQGAPSTALRRFSSLKNFFNWYNKNNNPCTPELFEKLREKPQRMANFIKQEDALYLLERCKNNPKHYAIVHVFLNTGLRKSEVINLSREIVDSRIRVITKGNVERSIKINTGTEKAIREYLATRTDNSPYMFVTDQYNDKYSESGMYKLLKELMGRAYIEENDHPHALRTTYAYDVYNRTHDVFAVQKLLGHKNIRTTLEYLKTLPDSRENQIQEGSVYNIG